MARYEQQHEETRAHGTRGTTVFVTGPVTTIGLSAGTRAGLGAIFGVIGALLMAIIPMFLALAQTGDFWRPLKAIAATFFGEAARQPEWAVTAVVVGMLFHLFNGAWLGALFGLITPNLGLTMTVLAGLILGAIEGLGALFIVLPVVDPLLAQAWQDRVLLWVLIHLIFGFIVGLYPLGRGWFARQSAI